jgi:ATP-dependent DNA helicase PIF1
MIFDHDQKTALARINEGRNVFVTGSAGTGKSSVTVEAIRRRLGDRSLKVCATTGVAALNLRDKLQAMFGEHVDTSTLYRWAGIGIGPKADQSFNDYLCYMQTRGHSWKGCVARIRATNTLVLDEVSMLPGRILEFVDYVTRSIRQDMRPFGGIQVIAVGDFLQLPPVSKTGHYDWAFSHPVWDELGFSNITLRQVHRQTDPDFISILNQFREGTVTKAGAEILKKRVAIFPKSTILRLFTHNAQVDKWNSYQLGALDGEEILLTAEGDGPSDEVAWLQKNLVTPTELRIKRNARVMVTANLSAGMGSDELIAANGDMGSVTQWRGGYVSVRLDNGREIDIEPHSWEFDPTTGMETGKFTQYPLRLAWACTIHKSQGLTLDSALIDIRAAREPGQAYVAVSRVKSLDGLHLKDWFSGMFISPQAKEFHRRIAAGETGQPAAPAFKLS